MPTLNVCVQRYVNKKSTQNLLKLQILIFFSEALSITKLLKRREIFVILINFVCVFFIHIYIYIYINIYIYMSVCVCV